MTARNDPCPCGSGKKFKKCHGAAAAMHENHESIQKQAVIALNAGQLSKAIALAQSLPESENKFRFLTRCLISGRTDQCLQQALAQLAKWRSLRPHNPEPIQRELEIHLFQGNTDRARKSLKSWSQLSAGQAEFSYFSAILEQLQGNTEKALEYYAEAIKIQREHARQQALEETALAVASAIQMCETAAGNYPGSPSRSEDGMFGSIAALQQLEKRLLEWESDSHAGSASAEIKRIHANAWYNLGCAALADFSSDDSRVRMFQKAIDLDPEHMLARFNLAFAYNYSHEASPEQIFEAHKRAAAWLDGKSGSRRKLLIPKQENSRRVRLGYLSSDFRRHSVAHFIIPVLKQHDRSRFEIFIYHNHTQEDSVTAEARQLSDQFRNISRSSDEQATQIILDDGLDILVDLNGLTQNHRLAVLANRVAPIQVNWLGYPNTTGLAAMDYRLVDALTDPPGSADRFYTEALTRLPAPFLSFASLEDPPPLSPLPCETNGFISFGSFNALPKLNPPLLECWAEILLQVPDSRLLVKNLGMDYDSPRQQITGIFSAKGIDPQRISFAGKNDSQAGHLQFYHQIDICLDSYPYNGTTTTCDSLLMGVPVVSRAGSEHRSRVGLSLLSAIGLESLVACSENEFIKIATSLAADRNRLLEYRSNLRQKLLSSPLSDAASLAARLEQEILKAREKWQANEVVS